MLIITPLAAAILTGIYIQLTFRVIGYRRQFKVSVGDGDNDLLARAMRAQANFNEYTPLFLLLLGCLEWNSAPWWLTSPLAMAFVIGRFIHPTGIKTAESPFKPRVYGMYLTIWPLIIAAAANLLLVGWTLMMG